MFDIALSELVIIGVVTLVVVGPKRLPAVARVAGRMLGQMNRYVSQVKAEVQKEMEKAELAEIRKEFEAGAETIQSQVNRITHLPEELSQIENTVQKEITTLTHSLAQPPTPAEAIVTNDLALPSNQSNSASTP